MADNFQHLLSQIKVGPKTLRNRVLITGHVPGVAEAGRVGDAYIAYQRTRARGGAGLQVTGSTQIHPTGSVGGAACRPYRHCRRCYGSPCDLTQ